MPQKVADNVLVVLSRCVCTDDALVLPEQLDRPLYEQTNKVLALCGGKWDRKRRAHLFFGTAEEVVEQVILTGEVTNTRRDFQDFPTPRDVVGQLVDEADLARGMRALEPSCGSGAILGALVAAGCDATGVEVQMRHATAARAIGAPVLCYDFLALAPEPTFDRVVMNPPFAKRAEVAHVRHALRFVRPGGVLVTVMSAGILYREDRSYAELRETFHDVGRHRIDRLPMGSFSSSGTNVDTVMVAVEMFTARA